MDNSQKREIFQHRVDKLKEEGKLKDIFYLEHFMQKLKEKKEKNKMALIPNKTQK